MKKLLLFILFCLIFSGSSAQENLIYHNDFNSSKDWDKNPSGSYTANLTCSNGKLILNPQEEKKWFESTLKFDIDTKRNFSIETSMAMNSKNTYSTWYGIIFGAATSDDNQFMIVNYSKSEFRLQSYKGEIILRIKNTEHSSMKTEMGAYNKIKIEKVGEELNFYINDEKVASNPMLEFYGNKIGFKVSEERSVAVDYLTIKYLPANYNPNTVITKNIPDDDELKKALRTFYQENKYDDGIDYFTNAIKDNPKSGFAYYGRGFFYSRLSNYNLAIKDYSETIALGATDENLYQSYSSRGEVYFFNNQYDLAIKDYDESIRLMPENNNAFLGRGEVLMQKGLYDEAIQDFSEAIRISPNFVLAYYARTKANKTLGKYELAIQDLKKCIEINSKLGGAYIGIISPLVRMLNFEQAKDYFQQYSTKDVWSFSSESSWKFYQYYITAAAENIPNGSYELALQNLNKGLSEYGGDVDRNTKLEYTDMLSLKGYVLEKLVRQKEAAEVYNKSLSISANQPEVKRALSSMGKVPIVLAKVDKNPPTIILTSPAVTRGLKVVQKNKQIIVIGKATDESGIYEVMVNGVEAGVDAVGNFSASIPLAIGDNQLMVTATDAKMNRASFSFTINRQASEINQPIETPIVAVNEIEVKPDGKYYALIIGVQDYRDETINDLDQPIADASSLYQILTSNYTFDKQNVSLLKNPTRDQLFESLENLSRKVKSNDNLLIFYAGHGFWDENRSQGYWFPTDARRLNRSSWLTNADLKEYISAIKSKHTLLISDACFSGGIFKSRSVMAGASRAVRELYELPSRKAMTSGTLKEVPDKSVFILYLVKRLQQNTERYLSAEQLFSSMRSAVINNSANGQVPQFGEIKEAGDEGGDFIFIRK